jgi:hypothetical protein
MKVIVMEVVRKVSSTVMTGVIGSGIGPLAGDGLDEAFSLAVGLGAIRFGEEMFEAELKAGGGEGLGLVGGAPVGEEALDADAMSLVEGDGLMESLEDAGGAFIRAEGGESEAGVIVDGDVQGLDAGAWVALGTVASGADAWAMEAAELLDVEVEEFAGCGAFVAQRRRFGRIERREAIEVMTAQDAGESGLGDWEDHHDLSVGASLAAQSEDLGFELGRGLAGLMMRHRRTIDQASGKAAFFGASQPAADGLFADPESDGSGAQGEAELRVLESHLGSGERSKSGISVHDVRAVWRWVES